ncbi:DUF4087 domain-containing protein [Inquilinus sp. NPDC058860]|uniref:DUF4087 domain-containing protein n=1 Tax=Inquilinus sp. NPDC058860 TaxID=3346652 RepID=UPI0036B36661
MRRLLGLCLCLILCSLSAAAAERRCGWLANPTPGDLLLTDRQGDWWITSQGQANGPDAAGVDNVPAFDDRQFVETNVPGSGHGYGCACLTVDADAKARRITKVISGQILPLSRCRGDKALPKPD